MSEADSKKWEEEFEKSFAVWMMQHVGLKASEMKAIQYSADDWTFIIKIHALIEVALNHMLAGQMRQGWLGVSKPEVTELIERFPVHGKTGKIALARALGTMSKGAESFIGVISKLRGLLVHDIKNFNFDLTAHLKTLKPQELEQWKTALTFNLAPPVEERFRELMVAAPKFAIWNGCMSIFAISFAAQPLDAAKMYRDLVERLSKERPESSPKGQP
jgi:hypothetical protein